MSQDRSPGRARPPGRLRPVPERSADFAHLPLGDLRDYRRSLQVEESRVSYWRRLVQARLDLLAASTGRETPSVESLRRVFAQAGTTNTRTALLAVIPLDDMPPLPDLAELWEEEPVTPAEQERAARRLTKAEKQLSGYRTALHQRLDAATAELIARYREDPLQCLTVLPQDAVRQVAGA